MSDSQFSSSDCHISFMHCDEQLNILDFKSVFLVQGKKSSFNLVKYRKDIKPILHSYSVFCYYLFFVLLFRFVFDLLKFLQISTSYLGFF